MESLLLYNNPVDFSNVYTSLNVNIHHCSRCFTQQFRKLFSSSSRSFFLYRFLHPDSVMARLHFQIRLISMLMSRAVFLAGVRV